ncbi:uncharacterized protein BO88DRAFT_489456 [Aspergillus vadensis CBS 113365]|uniref:Uncharacterized protein n=1 Tax=Aspergillus vadensis (strain CBS 113365 / IMI 142717 / IBT 24658) TaxID=1448311 RepID=A0A319CFM4_ASPVC|nr:hypothetical protein BO88DRAFT_489456 [Aspergillus vadensis CBS 113365]PYH67142.1 hypothetical protein BO88DRAFT_489456 [Aspergillus vadensis CBS 113365]
MEPNQAVFSRTSGARGRLLECPVAVANVPQPSLLTHDPRRCPRLGFAEGQLRALHGRHRVQAGATVLPPTDRWWTVDLYEDDIGEELKTSLVEEYANQKKPTDGEIYRKIRQYEGEGNEAFRKCCFVAEDPADEPPEVTPTEEPGLTQGPISEPTQSPPQTGQPAGQAPVSSDYVNISFWSFGRDEWRQSDCLRVNPSDPSPVSRIARKYSWKNYSLYDKTLQSLSPAQCYRAATVDGNNAIFLISEHEEQRLAAEGRLNKDRHLLFLVSQVRDRAETQPKSPNKRHCSTSLGRV